MNVEHLLELKSLLEGVLEITKWNPSFSQLEQIRVELNNLPNKAIKRDISKVVYGIYKDPIQVWVIKGLDTSRAHDTMMKIQDLQDKIKNMEKSDASTANNQPAERKD